MYCKDVQCNDHRQLRIVQLNTVYTLMEHAQLSNILAFKSVMAGSLFLVFPTFVYRNKCLRVYF